MIRDILNPSTYNRVWTVSCDSMHVGKVRSFWWYKNACKCILAMKKVWPIIELKHEPTGLILRVHDTFDKTYKDYVWPKDKIDLNKELLKHGIQP